MDMAVDIETKGLNAKEFLIGCAIRDDRTKERYFYTPEQMWQYINKTIEQEAKRGHKTNIYAHHHLYDFSGYAQNHLHELTPETIKRIKKKTPIFYILKKTGYILDTMNLFGRVPLWKLGEMINTPKIEMPKELTETNRNWTTEEIKKLKPYIKRDCEIVLKSVQMLKHNLENIQEIGHKTRKLYTASGTSYNFFKQYCRIGKHNQIPYFEWFWDKNKKGTTHKTKDFKTLSNAYRGARVECFKKGKLEDLHAYDVNSMYPYCMSIMKIPDLRTERKMIEPKKETLEKIGVSKVTIKAPNKELMYLPIRYKGKQIYPKNCTITGTWTNEEITIAIEEGYKLEKIHESIIYDETPINPFKKYLEKLFELKKGSTGIQRNTIKLLMNSLYGRWAMQITEEKEALAKPKEVKEYEKKGYINKGIFGNGFLMIKEGKKIPSKNTHPIISILTTAKARTKLYYALKTIPIENLVYTDTDSIITEGNHDHLFTIGKQMGEWTKEHENAEGYFAKEKNYAIGKKIVTAGVPIKEESIEYLKGEKKIRTKQMISHQQGIKLKNLEIVGTFYEQEKTINPTTKRDIVYPEVITEEDK